MARLRVEDVDLDNRVLRIAGLKGHPDHYIGIGSKPALALNRGCGCAHPTRTPTRRAPAGCGSGRASGRR
jgi:hypothetical protein